MLSLKTFQSDFGVGKGEKGTRVRERTLIGGGRQRQTQNKRQDLLIFIEIHFPLLMLILQ